jgi:hypothetical protein
VCVFEEDKRRDLELRERGGKVGVRSLVLSGRGVHAWEAGDMGGCEEVRMGGCSGRGAGHYIAEENLEGFVKEGLEFVGGG